MNMKERELEKNHNFRGEEIKENDN